MADFEGRLENAPVVYVLCQVRFSPVEKMAAYVPAIQEALRGQYPSFERDQISGVSFSPNAPPVFVPNELRWRFETRDNLTGFILHTNQLVAHTTKYVDSDDFRERIVSGLRTIHEIARLGFIQRIGLRYIDLITASADDSLEDYVDPSLHGFRPSVPGLKLEMSQQLLRTSSIVCGHPGRLLVKASRGNHTRELPLDLLPSVLKAQRTPPENAESIFLDWDHYVENVNLDPDPEIVDATVRELKAPIATIFKKAITPHAVKRWQSH